MGYYGDFCNGVSVVEVALKKQESQVAQVLEKVAETEVAQKEAVAKLVARLGQAKAEAVKELGVSGKDYGGEIKVREVNNGIEVKKAKIASLIRDINETHRDVYGGLTELELLRIIFDYDELNDYGKQIIESAAFVMTCSWTRKLSSATPKLNKNSEQLSERKWITREWVDYCKENNITMKEAFYFILCALLVVTVDKTNKEQKLSMICDFARMFGITDDEIKDIVEIIKIILGQNDLKVLLQKYSAAGLSWGSNEHREICKKQVEEFDKYIKSYRTPMYFSKLIEKYVGISGEDFIAYRKYKTMNIVQYADFIEV